MRLTVTRVSILVCFVVAGLSGTASASTITFGSPSPDFANNTAIPNGYGSIPGVGVAWSGACAWSSDYGDLSNVAFAALPCSSSGAIGQTTFTAGAGQVVNLQSFDLGGYLSGGTYYGAGSDHRVEIRDENNVVVFDSGLFSIPQGSHTSITPNLFSTVGGSLTIRFDAGGSPDWYVGIDNIAFEATTPVGVAADAPEPATMVLLGTGLLAAARSRKKRRA